MVLSISDNSIIRNFEVHWTEELMYEGGAEMCFENSMNPAREIVHSHAEYLLDSLDISPENEGVHCICHPLSDRGVDPNRMRINTWYEVVRDEHVLSIASTKSYRVIRWSGSTAAVTTTAVWWEIEEFYQQQSSKSNPADI